MPDQQTSVTLSPLETIESLMSKGSHLQALEALDKLLAKNTHDAKALTCLARILAEQKKHQQAYSILVRALAIDPHYGLALISLARSQLELGNFTEAESAAIKALQTAPHEYEVVLGHGQVMVMLGHHKIGKESLHYAATLNTESPWPHLGLAMSYFLEFDIANGFKEYVWRKKLDNLTPPKSLPFPSGDLSTKRVIVYQEQGLGDSLQFLRYLPLLLPLAAKVVLQINPKLWPVVERHAKLELASDIASGDSALSLMDLPLLFGVKEGKIPTNVPYLRAPDKKILKRPTPGTRLRVGIVWGGNNQHAGDHQRSMPAELFMDLLALPGLELISVQKGEKLKELGECGGHHLIQDIGTDLGNFGDTAAFLKEIDLLITVDTSIAHLAGGLGLPVWCLLPKVPDWRWGAEGERTPWYPSMVLFRQTKHSDWEGVVTRVKDALKQLLKTKPIVATIVKHEQEIGRDVLQQAMKAMGEKQWPKALNLLSRAREKLGDDATLWANIGIALRSSKHAQLAVAAYRRAETLGGLSSGLATNLSNALTDLNRLQEAENLLAFAANHESNSALVVGNLGYVLRLQNRLDEAVIPIEKVLKMEPTNLSAQWQMAQIELASGKYKEGWRDYECRWQYEEAGEKVHAYPEWQGQSLKNKTLLVYTEQGFGDCIFATRFLSALKKFKGRVLVETRSELIQLTLRHGMADRIIVPGEEITEKVDYQVAMMSLPGILDLPPNGEPYFTPNPVLMDSLKGLFTRPGFKVGFVWSGSKSFKDNFYRAGSLEDFLPLLENPAVQLYSLQMGGEQAKVRAFSKRGVIFDLSEYLVDFEFTAAALQHLDLIIMTDSSVAHLAGALGRPVWVVLGTRPYWLWGEKGPTTPWYNSMRIFRARKTHADTMGEVIEALNALTAAAPASSRREP